MSQHRVCYGLGNGDFKHFDLENCGPFQFFVNKFLNEEVFKSLLIEPIVNMILNNKNTDLDLTLTVAY